MLNAQALAKSKSKEKLASSLANIKNKLQRANEVVGETVEKAATGGTTLATFAASRYTMKRRELDGKRNTFDKKGKWNVGFWGGLGVAAVGVTPFSGPAGRYLVASGVGAMCAGSIPAIDKAAAEHHAAKKKK